MVNACASKRWGPVLVWRLYTPNLCEGPFRYFSWLQNSQNIISVQDLSFAESWLLRLINQVLYEYRTRSIGGCINVTTVQIPLYKAGEAQYAKGLYYSLKKLSQLQQPLSSSAYGHHRGVIPLCWTEWLPCNTMFCEISGWRHPA